LPLDGAVMLHSVRDSDGFYSLCVAFTALELFIWRGQGCGFGDNCQFIKNI